MNTRLAPLFFLGVGVWSVVATEAPLPSLRDVALMIPSSGYGEEDNDKISFIDYLQNKYKGTAAPKDHYLFPNEFQAWRFFPALDATDGVLIAPGTFRGLTHYALGKHLTGLVQADYDPNVREFNEVNHGLILKHTRLSDYLEELLGFSLDSECKRLIETGDSKAPSRLKEAFSHAKAKTSVHVPDWATQLWRTEAEKNMNDLRYRILQPINPTTLKDFEMVIGPENAEAHWRSQYYGVPALYRRVREGVRSGNLLPIRADLAGDMLDVMRFVRSAKRTVGAIDISNCIDHKIHGFDPKKIYQAVHLGLMAAKSPFSQKAVIMGTRNGTFDAESPDRFIYYSFLINHPMYRTLHLDTFFNLNGGDFGLAHMLFDHPEISGVSQGPRTALEYLKLVQPSKGSGCGVWFNPRSEK